MIDADAITRELQQPGNPVVDAMVERFGPGIVAADASTARRWPTSSSPILRLPISTPIVHPAVGAEIAARRAGRDRDGPW